MSSASQYYHPGTRFLPRLIDVATRRISSSRTTIIRNTSIEQNTIHALAVRRLYTGRALTSIGRRNTIPIRRALSSSSSGSKGDFARTSSIFGNRFSRIKSTWLSIFGTSPSPSNTRKNTTSTTSTRRKTHLQDKVYFKRPRMTPGRISPRNPVPSHILRPPYAETGIVPYLPRAMDDAFIPLHDQASIERMRHAAKVARRVLDLACSLAKVGTTTDEIDRKVHETLIETYSAYPSPLNYAGFPKSLCSSINEVICHGIPDSRPLQLGDIVSFDVSCFVNGVHGDNCATVIVGDIQDDDVDNDHNGRNGNQEHETDWRGIPVKTTFSSAAEEEAFVRARRLVNATRESLYAAISVCHPHTGCLSDIGRAIQDVAESYGYSTVERYRGHGINSEFHCAPFVKHYRNDDKLQLRPGMIFTIEPMLVEGDGDCFEWSDNWTVVTVDGSLSAQFEHTIVVSEEGEPDILNLP